MTDRKQPGADLELLTSLAKRFAERKMFDEATELVQLARRLDPKNLGVKLNLAQLRQQQKQAQGRSQESAAAAVKERLRRNAIDASHFFGLAALYEERGKTEQAAECLEIARSKDVINPFVHKLHGKILYRRRHFTEAAAELGRARRFNPFDRETAEILGRAEYERERYAAALEATIDAFLLLRAEDREGSDKLKKQIRTLKALESMSSQDLVALFRDRREKLETAFDRLEWQRERFLRDEDDDAVEALAAPRPDRGPGGRIRLAARVRELGIWTELADEQVFQLTRVIHPEEHRRDERIFAYRSAGADIYVLEAGKVAIRRPTAYGTYDLGALEPGAVFGEVNFISRSERSGDAIAVEPCRLLRLDAGELERLIGDQPDLGLHLYSSFWRGLAAKLRTTNQQLETFFSADATPESFLKLRRAERPHEGAVDVGSDDKIRLFREQGLSGAELTTLANFSKVKRFAAGAHLFHEGDAGEEMYVVLEGRVLITKFIPGAGDEALAILGRGDFFGEMSLIDGQPRSADAKAFEGPVTVVAFNDTTLSEVMAMDPPAALEFMALLCRLISDRLREIDEKVVGWRILSGDRTSQSDTKPIDLLRIRTA